MYDIFTQQSAPSTSASGGGGGGGASGGGNGGGGSTSNAERARVSLRTVKNFIKMRKQKSASRDSSTDDDNRCGAGGYEGDEDEDEPGCYRY